MFNLMDTGSRPKIPFELHCPVRMAGHSICRTGFKPQGLHDFPTILPMISRGSWLVCSPESRYKGLCRYPDSMDGLQLAVHGTGYPLPGGYDALFLLQLLIKLSNSDFKSAIHFYLSSWSLYLVLIQSEGFYVF